MEVAKNRAGGARNPWCLHPHTCPNFTHSDLPMMKELEGMGEDREQHGERQIESSESSVQWRCSSRSKRWVLQGGGLAWENVSTGTC